MLSSRRPHRRWSRPSRPRLPDQSSRPTRSSLPESKSRRNWLSQRKPSQQCNSNRPSPPIPRFRRQRRCGPCPRSSQRPRFSTCPNRSSLRASTSAIPSVADIAFDFGANDMESKLLDQWKRFKAETGDPQTAAILTLAVSLASGATRRTGLNMKEAAEFLGIRRGPPPLTVTRKMAGRPTLHRDRRSDSHRGSRQPSSTARRHYRPVNRIWLPTFATFSESTTNLLPDCCKPARPRRGDSHHEFPPLMRQRWSLPRSVQQRKLFRRD